MLQPCKQRIFKNHFFSENVSVVTDTSAAKKRDLKKISKS
jgi:hypothetical protein